MLDSIITAYSVIFSVIYYSYYVSLKCGQTIVTLSANFANTFVSFGSILMESLKIFLEDIFGTIVQIYGGFMFVLDAICGLIGDMGSACYKIYLDVCTFFEVIINCPLGVIRAIRHLFVFIRDLIILIGAGMWFAITFIPYTLYYLATSTAELGLSLIIATFGKIKQCTEIIKTGLYDLYYFVTDVPLESLAGLIIGMCMVYILFQFYFVLHQFLSARLSSYTQILKQKSALLYNKIRRRFLRREPVIYRRILESRRPVHLRRETINRRTLIMDRIHSKVAVDVEIEQQKDQGFCVICQERQKCILILPCRHVCLCSECHAQMQMYNRTCPMCRNNIEMTMKVFV